MPRSRTFEHRFVVRAPLPVVRAFHERADAVRILTPGRVDLVESPPVAEGARIRLRLYVPWPVEWRGHYENVTEGGFDDVGDEGPFASWRHEHRYREVAPGVTEVHDRIVAEPRALASRVMWAALRPGFAYRARATRRACQKN